MSMIYNTEKEAQIVAKISVGLIVIAAGVAAIWQVLIALRISTMWEYTNMALCTGATAWLVLVITAWVMTLRGKYTGPLWSVLLWTAVGAGSMAGTFIPPFVTFALWANTLLIVLIFLVAMKGFSDLQKD